MMAMREDLHGAPEVTVKDGDSPSVVAARTNSSFDFLCMFINPDGQQYSFRYIPLPLAKRIWVFEVAISDLLGLAASSWGKCVIDDTSVVSLALCILQQLGH